MKKYLTKIFLTIALIVGFSIGVSAQKQDDKKKTPKPKPPKIIPKDKKPKDKDKDKKPPMIAKSLQARVK